MQWSPPDSSPRSCFLPASGVWVHVPGKVRAALHTNGSPCCWAHEDLIHPFMPHTVQPAVAHSRTAACLHQACRLAAGLLTYALHCSPALQGCLLVLWGGGDSLQVWEAGAACCCNLCAVQRGTETGSSAAPYPWLCCGRQRAGPRGPLHSHRLGRLTNQRMLGVIQTRLRSFSWYTNRIRKSHRPAACVLCPAEPT